MARFYTTLKIRELSTMKRGPQRATDLACTSESGNVAGSGRGEGPNVEETY